VIVTVTLNPMLHVEYAADKIAAGALNPVRRVGSWADGRGLAVARVLHTFGHDVVAAGLAGGAAGETIRNELARAGVATQFTRIGAEPRRVMSIADGAAGLVTSFAEPSPYITTEELGRLASDYRSLLTDATAVVLCGSLPDGLPAEIYGSFVSYATQAGVPVVLDASGSALGYGAARGPALVVPEGRSDDLDLTAAGAVGTVTDSGVSVRTANEEWLARVPRPPGDTAAGAGSWGRLDRPPDETFRDALVAGFVPGIALSWSWPDTLRHAVALAAAWGVDQKLDVQAYEDALTGVRVHRSLEGDSVSRDIPPTGG
jgi:tagatose 6-phosphate kinase